MEQNQQSANGTTQDAHGETEMTASADDKVAYETFQKTLKQRHRFKEEAEKLQAELESYRQKELEEKGKHQELNKSLRKRLEELESENRRMQMAYQENVVSSQIMSEFQKRGISNAEKAWKFARAAHKDDLNLIEVDDQYQIRKEDLSRFADKFLSENADMGWVSRVGVKDISPGKNEFEKEKQKPLSQMTREEVLEQWARANN